MVDDVIMYRTKDGEVFSNREKAARHERVIALRDAFFMLRGDALPLGATFPFNDDRHEDRLAREIVEFDAELAASATEVLLDLMHGR